MKDVAVIATLLFSQLSAFAQTETKGKAALKATQPPASPANLYIRTRPT